MGCASSKDLDEATLARKAGNNDKAIDKYKEAIAKQQEACTPCGGPSLIRLHYGLGNVYQDQARYTEALESYESALAKQTATLGPQNPSLGNTCYSIATVYHAQGNFPEAEKKYKEAMRLWGGAGTTKQMASLYSAMASMYESQAKFKEAQTSYQNGNQFWDKLLNEKQGPDNKKLKDDKGNPELVIIYLSMAGAFNSLGETDKAKENFKLAEQVLDDSKAGTDHPLRGQTYEGMAEAYNAQGKAAEALKYYGMALKALKKHPSEGKVYDGMAGAYFAQNKTQEALEQYNNAEKIWKAWPVKTKDGQEVANRNLGYTYDAMASVHMHRGEFLEAINKWKQAFDILQHQDNLGLKDPHPDLSGIHYGMATACKELALFDDALGYYDKALAMQLQTLGKQTIQATKQGPQIGNVFYGQASIYNAQGKLDKAKEHYQKALDFWKKALPANESILGEEQLGATYESMAGAEAALGNRERAEEYYKKAEGLIKEETSNKGLVYLGMATLYADQGKKQEAETYHKKAERVWRARLRKEHYHMGNTKHSLGNLADSKDAALELYQDALTIQERELGKDHPCVAGTLYSMASAEKEKANTKCSKDEMSKEDQEKVAKLEKEHKWAELKDVKARYDKWNTQALEHYTRAMQIQERKLGGKHPHLAATYFGLAVVYDTQQNMSGLYSPEERAGQRQKAQDFFKKAEKCYPEGDGQRQYALKRIDSIEKEMLQEEVQKKEHAFNNQGKPMTDGKDNYPVLAPPVEAKEASEIGTKYKELAVLTWKTRTTTVNPAKGKDGDTYNMKALAYLEKAMQLQEKLKDANLSDTYFSMGEVYQAQSKMELVWNDNERKEQKANAKKYYDKVDPNHPKAKDAQKQSGLC